MRWSTTNGTYGIEIYFALSGLFTWAVSRSRGDVLRFASHLPLAFIFRAFGAVTQDSLVYLTLLIPQRRRWIQARGAEGGEPGGEEGDDEEQYRHRGEGHGIGGFDFDEHAREYAR